MYGMCYIMCVELDTAGCVIMKEEFILKIYKMNSMMVGLLYFLGTVFGILSTVVGGKVMSSIVQTNPLSEISLLDLIVADSSRILWGSFFILLMGISLVGMTAFLYPILKKDSEELAMGMLLFRGVMEGVYYFLTTISFIILLVLSREYASTGSNSSALQSIGNVVYQFIDLLGPLGAILFLIGATCLYVSFYRTKLIPRWLSIWGLVGVVPYMAYALLHLFGLDNGIGLYFQMVLALQEMIMALWLIFKGFNQEAVKKLLSKNKGEINYDLQ